MSSVRSQDKANCVEADTSPVGSAVLFIIAILVGSGVGLGSTAVGESLGRATDATLLVLISLLFFELRLSAVVKAFGKLRFLAVAWCANFLCVPVIAFAIASVLLPGEPLLFAGLMIYLLAPCTDWFLGFTRMARGDTELGAALIPINLITQLALFPIWLWLFTPTTGSVNVEAVYGMLGQWFLLPFLIAQALRFGGVRILSANGFARLLSWSSYLLPLVLAALIAQIFAAHASSILANVDVFALVAVAVFLFFLATFFLGSGVARLARLSHPQHVLLSMTLASRNAPLMLALTAVAMPQHPLVLAVIVFGMLVEIPHLTLLKQLWLRRNPTHAGGLNVRRSNNL